MIILKIIFVLLTPILVVAYGQAGYPYLMALVQHPGILLWFGCGAIIYLVIHIILHSYLKFWFVFEHELTHSLFAVLTFSKVQHFTASETKGGEVQYSGSIGRFIVTLAPYFCPTFALMLLPLNLMLKEPYLPYHQAVIGGLLMYHLLTTLEELKTQQSDLHTYGLVFSLAFILVMNLIMIGVVLFASLINWSAAGDFLWLGLKNSYLLFFVVYAYIKERIYSLM